MLESLEDMNIKRMNVESPEAHHLDFDPVRDFTPEDWQLLKTTTEEYWKAVKANLHSPPVVLAFARFLANVNIIKPGFIEPPPELKPVVLKNIKDEEFGAPSQFHTRMEYFAGSELLYPEARNKLSPAFLREAAGQWDAHVRLAERLENCANIKILAPWMDHDELSFDNVNIEEIKEELTFFENNKELTSDELRDFARIIASMRIIDPSFTWQISGSVWEKLRTSITDWREEKSNPWITGMLADLKVISAAKVELTNEGLRLEMKPLEQKGIENPNMPVGRNF